MVAPVRIPNPPLLLSTDSARKRERLCALAYRATMRAKTGRAGFHYADINGTALIGDENYPVLVDAAPRLLELRIAPMAWCAFSYDVWVKYVLTGRGRSKLPRAPAPKWVYSEKRLTERLDWFVWQESKFLGGQIEYCEEHLRLLDTYVKMRARVMTVEGNDEVIRELVERMLPAREYERLLRTAAKKYQTRREALDLQVQCGEYIWQ